MKDLSKIRDAIAEEVTSALESVAYGAREDLQKYAEELTIRAVRAAELGDTKSMESINRRARLVAAKHQVIARDKTWETIENVAWSVIRSGIRAALAIAV